MPLFDTYFLVGPLILVVNPSGKSQSPKKVRDLNLVFTVSADALALNDAGASADTALTAKLDIVSASFLVLSMTPNYLYGPNNPCIQYGGRDLGTNLLEQVSRFRGGNDWNVAGPVRTSVNMVLKKIRHKLYLHDELIHHLEEDPIKTSESEKAKFKFNWRSMDWL